MSLTFRDRPAIYNLLVRRGDTFRRRIRVTANNQPMPLAGYTAAGEIFQTDGSTLLLPISCTIDAVNSEIEILIPDDGANSSMQLTANCKLAAIPKKFQFLGFSELPKGAYPWELRIGYPNGDTLTWIVGGVMVT